MNCAHYTASILTAVGSAVGIACPSGAIETNPTHEQISRALERGKEVAVQHRSPDTLYARFGANDGAHPGGFLTTKLRGVSVMAAHMALRGLEPSGEDIARVTEASMLQVSAVIFGDSPSFAVNSYMVLDQGSRIIKPITVRVDGQAGRTATWPDAPRFQAKVVASFNYTDFDPKAQTTITVFSVIGGEVRFTINLAQIE
jgi:hypothetical protein